jgi:lipopolysaccharide biosynthesis regulator YciM
MAGRRRRGRVIDLPPFLLGLAFVLVGVAAWYMGRRSAQARTVRLPRDYFIGLDHLINDRIDRAAEVFSRMADIETRVDDSQPAIRGDTAEIQFALGSLFRRRGEVDRAIALHTRLRDYGGPELQDKAAFALGLDYLSAGLMDRAERLFEELSASREYRDAALEHLLRVYEQQMDWPNALKIFHELPAAVQAERGRVAAHYLCELSEQALLQGDVERAEVLLRQAATHDAKLPRAGLLTARIVETQGDREGALNAYLSALETAPSLALEIIPRVLALSSQLGDVSVVNELTKRLQSTGRVSERQLAWLLATALPTLRAGQLPELAGTEPSPAESRAIGALLTRISDSGGRYQCDECGLNSVGWYWRCPKCRSWDTLRPAVFKWAERTHP